MTNDVNNTGTEELTDAYAIARFIKNVTKVTPVKLYLKGELENIDYKGGKVFGDNSSAVVFTEAAIAEEILKNNESAIEYFEVENDRRNSAIPMLDIKKINARIEPGAIIRDRVDIGKNAVIMMGAVINIGAVIGENTMIDMNAVVGARGTIGKDVHIGAGSVIAGVLEPPSKTPVIIEDGVLIGANAVVLEGVVVGAGAVVAAGSVVIEDVAPGTVVAGSPAKVIKTTDEVDAEKIKLLDDLRG